MHFLEVSDESNRGLVGSWQDYVEQVCLSAFMRACKKNPKCGCAAWFAPQFLRVWKSVVNCADCVVTIVPVLLAPNRTMALK